MEDTTFAQLISRYGYLAILVGTFLEGETIVLVAGFMAYQGYLSLPWIIVCAVGGSAVSDQGLFFLARFKGIKFLSRFPRLLAKTNQLLEKARSRHTALNFLALFFRFFYGLRNVSPIFLGLSSIPTLRFVALNAVGAVLWACTFSSCGYIFAKTLETFMGTLAKFEMVIVALLVAAGVGFTFYRRWKKARPAAVPEQQDTAAARTTDPSPPSKDNESGAS